MGDPSCRCDGSGMVVGEPRGHDEDGHPLFVQWACDCRLRASEQVKQAEPEPQEAVT